METLHRPARSLSACVCEDVCRTAEPIYSLSTDEFTAILASGGIEIRNVMAGFVQSIRVQEE